MPAIDLININHAYTPGHPVLQNLNLGIKPAGITCLLGSSGSGKTTVLRIIAGFETPRSGTVSIGGKTVTTGGKLLLPPHRRKTGFIFQDLALWPHMTVYGNIAFGLKAKKAKNIRKTVYSMLGFFDLGAFANAYPHRLSGGQQQLVAIARALVLQPAILLMDEPLANLDVKLKRKILAYIRRLRDEFDLTLVYVTHDHREAFALADEVVVLNEGAIAAAGTPAEIKSSKNEFVRYFIDL